MAGFKFDYKGKEKNIDVKICNSIHSQARGLMFKQKSKPLLFVFKNKKRRAIHSFFCKPFIAIWFDGNRIIDVKVVNDWRFSIKPSEKFDKLLEIPKADATFGDFLVGERKL